MNRSFSILKERRTEKHHIAKCLRQNMTIAEQKLWCSLRGNQLNGAAFRRQQVIKGFIVDFYCHAARLVIEVDGLIHEAQSPYDAERSQILETHGLTVIRFSNDQIETSLAAVLAEIKRHC